jgi:hypothetical protein
VPGGRVALSGSHLPLPADGPPHVLVGGLDALVVAASPNSIRFVVPPDAEGGSMPVRIDELPGETAFLEVGRPVAAGLHQVDSPLFDREGRLYATESGERGSRPSVPLHRFALDSTRTSLVPLLLLG